jgi:hypothetical protein
MIKKIKNFFSLRGVKHNMILKRLRSSKKIRVGFLVVFDSIFQSRSLFELMAGDDLFEPFIVVIPDVSRGEEHLFNTLNYSYDSLSSEYQGMVFKGAEGSIYNDFSNKMDIAVFSNPYDSMTHEYFQVRKLNDKVLPIFINYFYLGKLKQEIEVIKSKEYSLFWKIFLENKNAQKIVKKYSLTCGRNTFVSGYCKMDKMKEVKVMNHRQRKKIIIAPHHTVRNLNKVISISNFEVYSELFLRLPKIYPDIDFIFRPHPLLFFALSKEDVWGKKRVESYLEDLQGNANLSYDTSSCYFDTFVNSDGLIHDCGSFLAEYFYTDKPQGYMLRGDKSLEDNFMPEGVEMLDFTYKILSEKDVLKFIDEVILKGSDTLKESRVKFAKEKIRINYPNASMEIVNYIKNQLRRKEND